ncbi:MAG TPA: DoxX family protein [Terracidiphilus sp.]|nr:DoxX family protein [Terracidiphilus sp.]
MTFPQLGRFTDLGLLLLRVMVAVEFFDSGRRSFFQADERGKNLGMSKSFTRFIGLAEMAGALGIAFGVLTQLAALGLILVMTGAIYQKIYVWHTGFWGKDGLGWNYDLMFVAMNLVILFTAGGRYVLFR